MENKYMRREVPQIIKPMPSTKKDMAGLSLSFLNKYLMPAVNKTIPETMYAEKK